MPLYELSDYCPTCVTFVADGVGHFLDHHPEATVPEPIVRAWAAKDPARCPKCLYTFQDLDTHYELLHVPSVTLSLHRWGYRETVFRGEDGKFMCPWCSEKVFYSDAFQVCARGRVSVCTSGISCLLQEHAESCAEELYQAYHG